jgi:hypothetical protein
LKQTMTSPRSSAELLSDLYTNMSSEPLPEIPPAEGAANDTPNSESQPVPVELSEFTQRLASFGLGEAPDPLLTEARPPVKRRSQD